MLPPTPEVLLARQGFADAQAAMIGALKPLGYFSTGWYGTEVSDERGSFAVVDPAGPLLDRVGDFLNLTYLGRQVYVYVIGFQTNLLTSIALTRRAYMAISLLAVEPIMADVSLVLP